MEKVKNWDRYSDVMQNVEKFVKFGKDDKPNRYGVTRKMSAIHDIVENEKDPDDADFKWSDEDKMYYWYYLDFYNEAKKAHGGNKPVVVHYIND